MSRKKGRRGLEYDVAPDLVQTGATPHQEGAEGMPSSTTTSKARRPRLLDYEPTPFPGAHGPPGPSPKALASLKAEGMLADDTSEPQKTDGVAPPVSRSSAADTPPGKESRSSRPPPKTPPNPTAVATPPKSPPASTTPAPRERSRPLPPETENHEVRVARTIRLSPNVDAQVQAIASRFGVDLTAAVSIAITHGYQALAVAGFVKAPSP